MKEKKRSIRGLFFMLLLLVAVTSYVYADEAKFIGVNTSVTGQAAERKADLYQFTLTEAGKVNLRLAHENLFNTETYWTVELYADDLETKLQSYNSIGTDTSKTGASIGLSAGTYYVKVYARKECSHEFADKPYVLTVQYAKSAQWEIEYNAYAKEGNNSQATATAMKAGAFSYGTVSASNDVDYYKIDVAKPGAITVEFRHPNILKSDSYWKVQLVNEKTEVICEFDSKGTKKKQKTAQVGVTAGTYYVKIVGSSSSRFSDADYQIRVLYTQSKYWEKEYNTSNSKSNNSMIAANKIVRGKTYSGTISSEKDEDFLKFTNPSSRYVTITFSHVYKPLGYKWWKIALYNSKTKEIYSFESRALNKTLTKRVYLTKGTYYIKITKGTKWSPKVYKISVK